MVKITLGNRFFEHSEGRLSVELEREGFLQAIARLAPHILEDLSGEPLARYLETGIGDLDITKQHRVLDKTFSYRDVTPFWLRLENQWLTCDYHLSDTKGSEQRFIHDSCAKRCHAALAKAVSDGTVSEIEFVYVTAYEHYPPCPRMKELWNSLVAWAKKHNLVEREGQKRWCLESAFYTLDWWATNPDDQRIRFFLGFEHRKHPPHIEIPEPPSGLEEWHAYWEDEEEYIERMLVKVQGLIEEHPHVFENTRLAKAYRKAYRDEVDRYCCKVKKHFKACGWQQAREKPEFIKHLEWAVRFQVERKSYYSLDDSAPLSRANIKRQVEKIIDHIGLTNRLNLAKT